MSDEQEQEPEISEQEQEQGQEQEQQPEPQELSYEEQHIKKASKGGWRPIEDWIEQGKPAEEWVDARDFNNRGEYIGKLKEAHATIDSFGVRLENVNAVHEAQQNQLRRELEAKKTEALENGDADELNRIHGRIQEIQQEVQAPFPIDQELDRWNKNNTWIHEDNPKADRAKAIYARELIKPGNTMNNVLRTVNEIMDREFPNTPVIPQSEGGSRPKGNQSRGRALTMDDVTPDEMKIRSSFPKWADDKIFLQAITDSRREK